MILPDLNNLEEIFHTTQLNKIKKDGISCFTSATMSGTGAFCFCNDIEEWKHLYPAIIFIDALIDKDYTIYEEDELQNLLLINAKYINCEWKEKDFNNFLVDINLLTLNYEISFLGFTSTLFNPNCHIEFVEELIKGFNNDVREQEKLYFQYLYDFGH